MRYHIQEGSFDAPADMTDRTVNILTAVDGSLSIVVSRDRLESDETLDGFVKRQSTGLARQLTKFQETARKPAYLGPQNRNIQGVDLAIEFKQNGQAVYQRQAVFMLPDQRQVLILTISSAAVITSAQAKTWENLLGGFQLRQA